MKIEEIGDKLVEFMLEKKSISFVNINRFFAEQEVEYHGDKAIALDKDHPNILRWINWNDFAIDVYDYAMKKLGDKVEINTCAPLIYAIDGCILTIPVAKSIRNYKNERWLPVIMEVR